MMKPLDPYRPYPWWTKIWPLGRIYFAGWARGEEAGKEQGRRLYFMSEDE